MQVYNKRKNNYEKGMCLIVDKLKKMLLALSVVGLTLTVAGCGNDEDNDDDDMKQTEGGHSVPKKEKTAFREE